MKCPFCENGVLGAVGILRHGNKQILECSFKRSYFLLCSKDICSYSVMLDRFKPPEENYAWFQVNLSGLELRYGGQYLVIKNEGVLGAYPTFQAAFESVKGKERPETYIIQLCSSSIVGIY